MIGKAIAINIKNDQLSQLEKFMSKEEFQEFSKTIDKKTGLDHLDEHVYVKMYGFKDKQDYYDQVSVDNWTSQISVPLFAVHSRDDPITGH